MLAIALAGVMSSALALSLVLSINTSPQLRIQYIPPEQGYVVYKDKVMSVAHVKPVVSRSHLSETLTKAACESYRSVYGGYLPYYILGCR